MTKLANLSGSDYFHLLIDRKIKRFGLAGNISRIHFELEESANLDALAERLQINNQLKFAASIRYKLRWPLLPKWIETKGAQPFLSINHSLSEQEFQIKILNRKVDNEHGLVLIDLCSKQDGSKHVIISMHHALFDYQGMMNFVRALNDDFDGPLFPEKSKTSAWKILSDFHYMTVYMLSRNASKLGSLLDGRKSKTITTDFEQLTFSKDQSEQIDENAWSAGSRIGTSAYLIAATSISVYRTLLSRGQHPSYLFFSIPHNQRKLGSAGHLYSNQLSFLFFRLSSNELKNMENAIASINFQLKQQIKKRITERYANLLTAMRFVPMFLYEKMVSLASNGRLASFGFSDLGTEQLIFEEWAGVQVKGVKRYPPVPVPPGISIATVKSDDGRKIVIGYGKELLTGSELELLQKNITESILNNPTP